MADRKGPRSRTPTAEERAKVFKALSDPSRVGIVDILATRGPLHGTELAERLGISLALLCHHWDVLAEAGIVQKDRRGQAQYCSLDLSVIERATSDWASKGVPRAARKAPAERARETAMRRPARKAG